MVSCLFDCLFVWTSTFLLLKQQEGTFLPGVPLTSCFLTSPSCLTSFAQLLLTLSIQREGNFSCSPAKWTPLSIYGKTRQCFAFSSVWNPYPYQLHMAIVHGTISAFLPLPLPFTFTWAQYLTHCSPFKCKKRSYRMFSSGKRQKTNSHQENNTNVLNWILPINHITHHHRIHHLFIISRPSKKCIWR